MSHDPVAIWSQVLPEVRRGVTGVGIWAALNACRAVALEDGTLVIGLSHEDSELSGHLRVPQNKRLIEDLTAKAFGGPLRLRVIDGVTPQDWENAKRRDQEARRLADQALQKARNEASARSNWDTVYEQLSRAYAAVPNKSMPQNRARFFEDCVRMLAEARRNQDAGDDLSERNFARCLERVAQYSEVPSTLVAQRVFQVLGEFE